MFRKILFVVIIGAGLLSFGDAFGTIYFSDHFNMQADWQPRPGTNDASPTGASSECGTPGQICNPLPPDNWSYYRTTGLWWDGAYNDTIRVARISKDGTVVDRGGSGKAFVVYNESNSGASGDGWGADGILTKHLGQDLDELYARVWIRTQAGWRWPAVEDMMVKMFRVYHYDGTGSIFLNGTAGNNAPLAFFDFKHSNTYGTRYMNTLRCSPQATSYFCTTAPPADALLITGDAASLPNGKGELADTKWHSIEFHLKMNTFNAANSTWNNDGIYELWYDGERKESHNGIQWKRDGSGITDGWNTISLGGNAYNTFTQPTDKGEQWYAMDDVVISSSYSGPPAKPVIVSAQGISRSSIKLGFLRGDNGAAHAVNGYRIYYGTGAGDLSSSVTVAGSAVDTTVEGLTPATQYYFAVTAFNQGNLDANANESLPSSVASARTVDEIPPELSLSSVTSPTRVASQLLSGTVADAGGIASVLVKVGAAAPVAATVTGNSWNCTIRNLTEGGNSIVVTAQDLSGNESSASGTIVLDTVPPVVNVAAFTTPTLFTSQTISGTVSDVGGVDSVLVRVGNGQSQAAQVSGSVWSFLVNNLQPGVATAITVSALDIAGNESSQSSAVMASIGVLKAGDLSGDTSVGVDDAQLAMQMGVGMKIPDAAQRQRGDLAPMVGGIPQPDGVIDTGDALLILGIVTGMVRF